MGMISNNKGNFETFIATEGKSIGTLDEINSEENYSEITIKLENNGYYSLHTKQESIRQKLEI